MIGTTGIAGANAVNYVWSLAIAWGQEIPLAAGALKEKALQQGSGLTI
jgi:hypothetical protein